MKFLNLLLFAFAAVLLMACVSESSPQQTETTPTSGATSATTSLDTSTPAETAPIPTTVVDTQQTVNSETDPNTVSNPTTTTTSNPVPPPTSTVTNPTTLTDPTINPVPPVMTTPEEEVINAQVEEPSWLHIPIHYKVLFGQSHVWGESGSIQSLRLAKPALANSTTIELKWTNNLLPQQLISYYGNDGEYYAAQIQSINGKLVSLATPLQQDLSAGTNVWNFYSDGSHPNQYGYNAIADYAVRHLSRDKLNTGVHILLGDSWFDEGSIFERLKQHLPAASIFNEGVGGDTSSVLLARFDEDVLPQEPNFVWIMTGTNDYWQDITAEAYKANIKSLIAKIKAINAVPIIFDASVGVLNAGEDTLTVLSHAYVTALEQLLTED